MARFQNIERGLYREKNTGVYYDRVTAGGKDSFVSLRTTKVVTARRHLENRRLARTGAKLGLTVAPESSPGVTVGEVIRNYQRDGYPDRQRAARKPETQKAEEGYCNILLEFWDKIPVEEVTLKTCDQYFDWRRRKLTRGSGERTVDLELNTLNNSMVWASRDELIRTNPLYGRIRYRVDKKVKHCREFMPRDSDELHTIAKAFFSRKGSEVLGWQTLFEAYSGLRTEEAIGLRTDAKAQEPGWITTDGAYLCVRRSKDQESVNPFATSNPGLDATLAAWRRWKAQRFPGSPWYLPSPVNPEKPIDISALSHALIRIQKTRKIGGKNQIPPVLDHKVTSHGMRAFYVTIRRSHGTTDAQIAWEIGHSSGGSTLAEVYGGIPPGWLAGKAPKFDWLPSKSPAAWSQFEWEQNEKICQMDEIGSRAVGQAELGGAEGPATTNSDLTGP